MSVYSHTNTDRSQIDFIQALRAIAAMMVLMWHFRSTVTGDLESSVLKFFFQNGFSGVDIFFVISGFIMVYTSSGKPVGELSAPVFLIKRFSRIWPLYVIGSIFYICFLWMLGWLDGESYKVFLLSMIFYPVAPHPTLDVGWTLNIEMYFYFVFAICLSFGRFKWMAVCFWVGATLLFQTMLGSVSTLGFIEWIRPYYNQAIHPCIFEFFAGMLIAAFYTSKICIRRDVGGLIAALLVSFSIWQYLEGFSAKMGITGVGMGATCLVLGFAIAEKSGIGWKPGKVLMWLGNISFSIYILHTTVGLSLTRLLNTNGMAEYTDGIGYIFFVIVLILVLSTISYEVVEKKVSAKFGIILIDAFNMLVRISKNSRIDAAESSLGWHASDKGGVR
jgi:exopolysaccharide production protein ExoZ